VRPATPDHLRAAPRRYPAARRVIDHPCPLSGGKARRRSRRR
jgi:hypothetical protein